MEGKECKKLRHKKKSNKKYTLEEEKQNIMRQKSQLYKKTKKIKKNDKK